MAIVQDVSVHQPGTVSPDGKLDYTFMDRRDLAVPFAGFAVLHDQEAEEPTEWGVKAVMVRFAARKPWPAHALEATWVKSAHTPRCAILGSAAARAAAMMEP